MPSWIAYRAPSDTTVETGRAPFDPASTDALVRAARSVHARPSGSSSQPRDSVYVVLLERSGGPRSCTLG